MAARSPGIIVGWREWVALPELGLPAVKAKVDTGAKTSSLHAFDLEVFRVGGRRRVRFGVHPVQFDEETTVWAEADVVDERTVTSSSGHDEHRVVIRTPLQLGDQTWPVEVTLTDRRTMRLRMLLGRQAMEGRLLVDPAASYLHGVVKQPAHLYRAR
ncbi:MAG: RimK/LysX family protein [Rhodothermales bacterium]|nr:RimK/LysX family protein [Rhodothermales bacterium]